MTDRKDEALHMLLTIELDGNNSSKFYDEIKSIRKALEAKNTPVKNTTSEPVDVGKVYSERMMAVRMLSVMSGCRYGVGVDDNEDWDDEWRNVVYIDLPQGQVSWHIAPHDAHLFVDFPLYHGRWDGRFNGNNPDFVKMVRRIPQEPIEGLDEDIERSEDHGFVTSKILEAAKRYSKEKS